MIVFSTRSDFSAWRKSIHEKIAFVPTMGALHSGHLELVKEAKKQASIVVVSIFVNPTQFNNPEDFKKYPQNLPSDLKKCEENGVDIVLAPTTDDMYAEKEDPIPLPDVALPLEGALRPGHFQGVVTIVSKLFKLVQPDVALFGLKDYQQVRVIQEMTVQQKLPIQIRPCPTVRSAEGLALSSRNERLSSVGLQKALKLSQTLKLAQDLFQKGLRDPNLLKQKLTDFISEDSELKIDSIDVVDAKSLLTPNSNQPWLVALAIFVEGVRLIDNCVLK